MRRAALVLALVLACSQATAQTRIWFSWAVAIADLPASADAGRIFMVSDGADASDCTTAGGSTRVLCTWDGSAWVAVGDGGGAASGDVTAVGDCATGSCFQSETSRHGFMSPSGGGVATFRAVVEADISDLAHTTDTGPSPDCSGTDAYQDGEGNCDTVGGDLSGGLDAAVVGDNSHNHTESNISDLAHTTSAGDLSSGTIPAARVGTDHIDALTELADLCAASEGIFRNSGDSAWECATAGGGLAYAIHTPECLNCGGAGLTRYLCTSTGSHNVEANNLCLAARAGTLSDLYCEAKSAPGSSENYTFTVRNNGSDTAITCAISDLDTSCSDLSNTDAVAQGDDFVIEIVGSAGAASNREIICALVFEE